MPVFIRILFKYWKKRLVRIAVALIVLAVAIFAQYRLANISLPVEVEKNIPPYTPASAALSNSEVLVVRQPTRQSGGTASPIIPAELLLSAEGKEVVTVDAHFESARLGDDIMGLLRRDPRKKPLPEEGLQQIDYATEGDELTLARDDVSQTAERAEPCQTAISVSLEDGSKLPAELHFSQSMGPGSDRYRYFEMKAVDANLRVQLLTRDFEGNTQAPGCRKTLSVGKWSYTFSSPVPLNIVVPAGASFRFSFTSLKDRIAWSPPNAFFEPFALQSVPLGARAVQKIALGNSPLTPALFDARSEMGAQPLRLKHLLVGSDELRLDFSGMAMVQENGNPAVTFDVLQFANRNRLLAAILGMLDVALLGWVKRTVFNKPKGGSVEA